MGLQGKVLIVDDDRSTLLLVQARLRSAGFEVAVRDHALGTAAEVIREKPDFVLLDIHMPGLSGDGQARLLVENGQSVVLHSAEDVRTLEERTRTVGALGFIAKTDDAGRFLEDFQRLVAKRRQWGG